MSSELAQPDAPTLVELDAWRADSALLAAANECVRASRDAWQASPMASRPIDAGARRRALEAVSPEVLADLLATGRDVHGIATEDEISTVVTFNAGHIRDAIHSEPVARARRRLDALVAARLGEHFGRADLEVTDSGHFLYPPASYMGWHTNSGAPGWRLYVTRADEPGRSFFRYREPVGERIVTVPDDAWNFRLFRITADAPLWHAIHSETHRFSFGYLVRPSRRSWWIARGLGALRGRLAARRRS